MDTSANPGTPYLRDHLGDQPLLQPSRTRQPLSSRVLSFEPRQPVFQQGEATRCLFEITEGAVMLTRLLPDGRRQVLEILGPGMWLGLTANGIHGATAEPLTQVQVRTVGLWALEQSGQIQQRVARQLAARLATMHDLATLLGRKTGSERVATFLLSLAHALAGERPKPETDHMQLNMRLADMADHLGLTVETVCREMAKLKRERLISQSRDGTLVLNDPEKLAELANRTEPPRGRRSRNKSIPVNEKARERV